MRTRLCTEFAAYREMNREMPAFQQVRVRVAVEELLRFKHLQANSLCQKTGNFPGPNSERASSSRQAIGHPTGFQSTQAVTGWLRFGGERC